MDPAITHFATPCRKEAFQVSKQERIALIEEKMKEILEVLGLDLNDPSLLQTPHRVAKMFVEEIFSGLDPKSFPTIETTQQNSEGVVLVKNISLLTFCEHHLVPTIGKAHIAYLPKGKILGLSKIHQIVRYFTKRPQLQERLTAQIADSLSIILETEDIALMIEAKHYCVILRDVEDHNSIVETHVLRGSFKTSPLRDNFFLRITKENQLDLF